MKTETEKLIGDIRDTEMNLSKALSGADYVNIGYKLVDPIRDLQEKVQKSLAPMDDFYKSLEATKKLTNITLEDCCPDLSKALTGINNIMGPLIVQINDPIKTLTEQMLETSKALSFPFEQYKSAIDLVPDYYSISKITRDESNEIDIYVKNTKKENAPEYNLKNAEADEGFVKFLHNITNEEAMDFLEHLQEFPYLALVNETGNKIFKAVQEKICSSIKKENNNTLYRARAKKDKDRDWTKNEIGLTQYGVPGMGRYNFVGCPVFYLATDIKTAKKEVENIDYPESTVIEYKQIKEMTVFDISTDDCPLISYCNNNKDERNNYTSYLIPNFLSVCCSYLNSQKRHSVDAIKYRSNKNDSGVCYVILDQSPLDFFDKGKLHLSKE